MTEAPHFEPRISLGSLLSVGSIMLTAALTWGNLSASMARQEEKLEQIMPRLGTIEARLDRADRDHEQLVQLENAIRELTNQRGRGP